MNGYWFNPVTNMPDIEPTGAYGKPDAQYFSYLKGLNGSQAVTHYRKYEQWLAPDESIISGTANINIYVSYIFKYVSEYNEELRKTYFDILSKQLPKDNNFALFKYNKHYQCQLTSFKGYKRDGIVDLWEDFQPSLQFVPPYIVLGVTTDGYINISFGSSPIANAGNTVKYKSQSKIIDGFNNEGYEQGGMYGVARVTII